MKIVLCSYRFAPDVGGIETASLILARELVRLGCEVIVVTQTAGGSGGESWPFKVLRRPTAWQLIACARWCDIFFQNNIALELLWPMLLVPRPLVIACHTWLTQADGRLTWKEGIKRSILGSYRTIAVSRAIATHLPGSATVVGNAYQNETFGPLPDIRRDKELIFLGRLVSDKGMDLLLEALGQLKSLGMTPRLTVVGDGPERRNLEQMVAAVGIDEGQVSFVGMRSGSELARLMNEHRILVVPSRWPEPFGIVALEGIACGCVVVGSVDGGLGEAIGACGATFPNGDAVALAALLARLLAHPSLLEAYRRPAEDHLARYRPERIAAAYLKIFEEVLSPCS